MQAKWGGGGGLDYAPLLGCRWGVGSAALPVFPSFISKLLTHSSLLSWSLNAYLLCCSLPPSVCLFLRPPDCLGQSSASRVSWLEALVPFLTDQGSPRSYMDILGELLFSLVPAFSVLHTWTRAGRGLFCTVNIVRSQLSVHSSPRGVSAFRQLPVALCRFRPHR